MKEEMVVLVDKNDQETGILEKSAAHQKKGCLHRAVSVLLYRKKNQQFEVLIQQRSRHKSLWPLFWTNTMCTHPRDQEKEIDCAVRRLKEEMGITIEKKKLTFVFKLLYQAKYNESLAEYELDHVFIGEWDGTIEINPEDVKETKWVKWSELQKDIITHSSLYAPWFILITKNPKITSILNTYE